MTSKGMETLAKVLAELREGDVGSDFHAIPERCRAFFDHESELLHLKAFVLFGKLAKVVRISKKHFFKEEVKKAWVPLMLHCQDPCSNAAQACVATMFQCVHFWGWKALESSSDQSDAIAPKDMTSFQITLCSVLTQRKPAVLYSFLLETMTYVKNNLSRIRTAACNLAGIIMKQMSARYLKKLDFPTLRNWPAGPGWGGTQQGLEQSPAEGQEGGIISKPKKQAGTTLGTVGGGAAEQSRKSTCTRGFWEACSHTVWRLPWNRQ